MELHYSPFNVLVELIPLFIDTALAFCESVASAHSGKIDVSSAVGKGSVFTVWLPMIMEPVQAELQKTCANEVGCHGRILVIDDEKPLCALITAMLQRDGHAVCATQDAQYALQLLLRQPFDAIIVDLQMPKMGGLDFLRAVKKIGFPKPPALLVVTGRLLDESLESLTSLGVFKTLLKPFSRDSLLEGVKSALASR